MKTIDVKLVYDAIVRRKGLDPATANLSAAQKANYAELVNERFKAAWEHAIWPEATVSEQRNYRATYDAGISYSSGDEVWFVNSVDHGDYYTSLKDTNLAKDPETETTWWEIIELGATFVRNIEFNQDGQTEINGVDVENCAFDVNPKIYPDRGRVFDVIIQDDSIIFRADQAPAQPWIRFRTVPPEFSWTEWVIGTDYSIGDLTYLAAQGESYKALQPSTGKDPYTETAYWEPVGFPKMFREYVVNGVTADLLTEDEGRFKAEGKAAAELERLEDVKIDQQAIRRPARYKAS